MSKRHPIIVADFTTNHMGNFNLLLAMVDDAAKTGCHYVKMQAKDVDSFYSKEKLAAPYRSPYGKTYGEYRRVFEFNKTDFQRFDRYCRERSVKWIATVQDFYSLELFAEFDLDCFKVASCNARNLDLLRALAAAIPRNKRVILSVAGSSLEEIEASIRCFPGHELFVLHCVAEYPCPPDRVRLGNLLVLRERFGSDRVRIGYSGHEEGFDAALVAVDLGAEMVEKHFCPSRQSFVHHIECALEPDEFGRFTEIIHRQEHAQWAHRLPAAAFRAEFGMSEKETAFLLKQTYGSDFAEPAAQIVPLAAARSGAPVPMARPAA